jgi:UDP-glucose:glycoprotein glucosyltransferase
MLINLELDKAVGMTKLIAPKFLPMDGKKVNKAKTLAIHNVVTLSQTALNYAFSKSESSALSQFSQKASSGIAEIMEGVESSQERNPLYFSWNEEYARKKLQVEVSVLLDPLTEPTQRVAPLLLAIRDFLKLPLKVLIAPRAVVENRAPLSSYYRFTLNPLAIADINPPAALFSNLPTNHLLTVRLDVPETFDVQQSFAVQDADNLRCDAKYGCGDEAYILTKNGREMPKDFNPSPGGVELTQIEYTLKSLLFFGQCYDATTSSPPNGLQLTLDRSKLPKQEPVAEMQINADGSISEKTHAEGGDSTASLNDHTDTLVMKTAGYWQLRANPGVWNLTIAERSRGAEIYHMVDGSLSFGRLMVDRNATSFISKSLVMKDFSDHRQLLVVKRNEGHETSKLFLDESEIEATLNDGNETVHVFSLATGHAYERLLKIMMLSVTKRTKSPVKFWFFENVSCEDSCPYGYFSNQFFYYSLLFSPQPCCFTLVSFSIIQKISFVHGRKDWL